LAVELLDVVLYYDICALNKTLLRSLEHSLHKQTKVKFRVLRIDEAASDAFSTEHVVSDYGRVHDSKGLLLNAGSLKIEEPQACLLRSQQNFEFMVCEFLTGV
jgi:hypothetical protein